MDLYDFLANIILISCFAVLIPLYVAGGLKKKAEFTMTSRVLVFVSVLYALGILAFAGLRYMNESASTQWPSTDGKIESVSLKTSYGKHTRHYPVPEFSYTVDNKTYNSKTIVFHDDKNNEDYEPGSTVTVYYQPSQPANSVLEKGVSFETGFLAIIGLVTIGSAFWALVLGRRMESTSVVSSWRAESM